ncbi:hypothetical protein [Kordiimonas sp.]|uniref:hypothetical protein n=1 Tax=Kordiimonas sp. TaxID=1970157 RepID=UPI003A90A0D7
MTPIEQAYKLVEEWDRRRPDGSVSFGDPRFVTIARAFIDLHEYYIGAMAADCGVHEGEEHCSCVPRLKREIEEARRFIASATPDVSKSLKKGE